MHWGWGLRLGVAAALAGVLGVAYALGARRGRRARDGRLAAELASARLDALRLQLPPHFVANALHGIGALMERDVRAAREMTERLGTFLRLALAHGAAPEQPLARELEALDAYLAVERLRLGGRVAFDVSADAGVRAALVPSLLLQPLVENALRHGLRPGETPGHVAVGARREGDALVLDVRDDGPGPSGTARGIGLRNTERRLEVLYGAAASLEVARSPGGGFVATVRLPYYTRDDVYELARDER